MSLNLDLSERPHVELAHNRLALVLSGGGVRSMAQIGVLRAMAKYNLKPEIVVGTSGGSIVAALYAVGLGPDGLEAVADAWSHNRSKLLDFNFSGLASALVHLSFRPFTGILKGKKLEAAISQILTATTGNRVRGFSDISRLSGGTPLFVIAVDLNDGEPIVFCDPRQVKAEPDPKTGQYDGYRVCGRLGIAPAVRASCSIPGVFVPASCLERCPVRSSCQPAGAGRFDRYIDGGVRDNLALAVAAHLTRAGLILGVNLGYAGMRREEVLSGGPVEIISQVVDIMGLDQVDSDLTDELVTDARVVVLNPMIYDVGTFELSYIPQLIARGEALAERCFRERGLVPGAPPAENRRRLFGLTPGSMLFPVDGTPAYQEFLRQVTEKGEGRRHHAARKLKE